MDSSSKNNKFAFIVFIILVIFCIAQLSWWVIFQINQSNSQFENQVFTRIQKIDLISKIANHEFSQMVDQANFLISLKSNPEVLNQNLELLLQNPAVLGYLYTDDNNQTITAGKLDLTLYAFITNQITLYFDKQYVIDLFEDDANDYIIDFSAEQDGQNGIWVNRDNIVISPQTIKKLKDKSNRAIKMFASEGTIFLLVMILGAYLIYRALQRSEELKNRQTNFMHAVTHELKTPLTSIRLYLQTLQSGNIDSSKTEIIYRKMIDDCNRLDEMVDDVLGASRFDSIDTKMTLYNIDLSHELNIYLNNYKKYIEQQSGTLNCEIQDGINIRANSEDLNRVIKTLIENGLKYSPPDRKVIDIKLVCQNNSVIITISDKGFGIENHETKKIFDRFYRVTNSNTEAIRGTGLGLFIAEQIIKSFRGTIKAYSDGVNKGTTFTIKLPMVTG